MEENLFNFLRYALGENHYGVEFFPKERLMELIQFIQKNEFYLSRLETTEEMMDYSFGKEWRDFLQNRIDEMKKEKKNIEIKDLNEESKVKTNYLDFNVINTEDMEHLKKKDDKYHCKYGYTEDEIEYGDACYLCAEGEFIGCPNYIEEKKAKPECSLDGSNDNVCNYCIKKEDMNCSKYKEDKEIRDIFFDDSRFNKTKTEGLEDIILKSVDEGTSSSTNMEIPKRLLPDKDCSTIEKEPENKLIVDKECEAYTEENKLIIDKEPEVAYTKPIKYYTEENYMKDMAKIIKDKEYEMVNHPSHYNNSSIETIEKMIRIWGKEQTAMWCEMTAFKYRERIGSKPDNSLEQEMGKIRWYELKARELRS